MLKGLKMGEYNATNWEKSVAKHISTEEMMRRAKNSVEIGFKRPQKE